MIIFQNKSLSTQMSNTELAGSKRGDDSSTFKRQSSLSGTLDGVPSSDSRKVNDDSSEELDYSALFGYVDRDSLDESYESSMSSTPPPNSPISDKCSFQSLLNKRTEEKRRWVECFDKSWGVNNPTQTEAIVNILRSADVKYKDIHTDPKKIYFCRGQQAKYLDQRNMTLGNVPNPDAKILDHNDVIDVPHPYIPGEVQKQQQRKEVKDVAPQGGINFVVSTRPMRSDYGLGVENAVDLVTDLDTLLKAGAVIYTDDSAVVQGCAMVVLPPNGRVKVNFYEAS